MKFPFLFRIEKFGLLVSSFFFDSSFLTSKSAQVVQFSATNFTYLVHFDAIDSRWQVQYHQLRGCGVQP